jgi:hypothetical protein
MQTSVTSVEPRESLNRVLTPCGVVHFSPTHNPTSSRGSTEAAGFQG